MTGQIIEDKINYFFNEQKKIHLTKVPNIKFPSGKFHNGIIGQVYDDKILFDDDVEGVIEILKFEIGDLEGFRREIK